MAIRAEELIQRISIEGADRILSSLQRAGEGGSAAFKKLENSVKGVQPAVERFDRSITTTNSRLERMNSSVNNAVLGLRRIAAVIGVAFSVRKLVTASDAFTDLNNKIRAATASAEEHTKIMEALRQVSLATGSELSTNGTLFVRFNQVMQNLGKTSDDTVKFIDTLNKALALGGVTGAEAAGGMRQLAQALGTGQLRGQELWSVLEQLPPIAKAIADELGTTTDKLLAMGKAGEISSETIVAAMGRLEKDVSQKWAGVDMTISRSMENLNTQFTFFVGNANKASGAASLIARAINMLAANLDIAAYAAAAFIGLWLSSATLSGIMTLVTAFTSLRNVIAGISLITLLNPLNLMIAAIAAIVGALGYLVYWLTQTEEGQKRLAEISNTLITAWNNTSAAIQPLINGFRTFVSGVIDGATELADVIENVVAVIVNLLQGDFVGALDSAKDAFGSWVTWVTNGIGRVISAVRDLINWFSRLGQSRQKSGGGPAMARGGPVFGPGTSTSDSIPARLSRGEFVVRAAAVRRYGVRFFDLLNRMMLPIRGYASGGLVQGYAGGGSVNTAAIDRTWQNLTRYQKIIRAALGNIDRNTNKHLQKQIDDYAAAQSINIDHISRALSGLSSSISSLKNSINTLVNELKNALAKTGRAEGGYISGPGTGTSDSIMARLSNGEYVMRAAAVRKYGVSFFDALNRMGSPTLFQTFNTGGLVQRFASGGSVGASSGPYAVLNLTIGQDQFDGLLAPRTVAEKLVTFGRSSKIASTGRKPGWY